MSEQILLFLGKIVAIGGPAAVIAFLLFRYLGKSWIESKFSERLEQFKHQQALEIQRLRIEIDSTLSGVLKIQEKEFETLPEAWGKLDEANNLVAAKNRAAVQVFHLLVTPSCMGAPFPRVRKIVTAPSLRRLESLPARHSQPYHSIQRNAAAFSHSHLVSTYYPE